jgi:hypothetical protein
MIAARVVEGAVLPVASGGPQYQEKEQRYVLEL